MVEDEYEISLVNRNGQSTCKEEDFAELLAARLNGDNIESQFSNISELPEAIIGNVPISDQPSIKTIHERDLATVSSMNERKLIKEGKMM